ncbi:MAG: hypothetical protein V1809_07080 [Planctomycetota bacterium]
MMALAPIGVWLGSRLNRILPEAEFRRWIYILLGVAAVKLLWDARGLWGNG